MRPASLAVSSALGEACPFARSMKKSAVAFVADLGKMAEGSRYRTVPSTGEAAAICVLRRDLKCRPGLNELTAEPMGRIIDFEAPDQAAPLDGGAHGRVGWGTRYQRAIRQAVGQGDPVEH